MKAKSIAIIVIILAVIALAIFVFKDKLKNLFHRGFDTAQPPAPVSAPSTTNTVYVHDKPKAPPTVDYWSLDLNKVLKKGSNGNEVVQLQTMINQALSIKKKPLLPIDGGFGSKTESALKYLTGKTSITIAQASALFVAALIK